MLTGKKVIIKRSTHAANMKRTVGLGAKRTLTFLSDMMIGNFRCKINIFFLF